MTFVGKETSEFKWFSKGKFNPFLTLMGCFVILIFFSLNTQKTTAQEPTGPLVYKVIFEPTGFSWLDQLIAKNSSLLQLQDRPPISRASLRRRVKREQKQLKELLKSEGFYAGKVELLQDRGSRIGNLIKVKVDPGQVFTNDAIKVTIDEQIGDNDLVSLRSTGTNSLIEGKRSRASEIFQTEQHILKQLANIGYPFAALTNRTVTVDHATALVSTEMDFASGPKSTFGSIMFLGLNKTNQDFLLEQIKLQKGETYSQEKINDAKKKLLSTGLFTNVNINLPDKAPAYGSVPIIVEVKERPQRQIAVSAGASLTNGPTGSIEWLNRDLFGKAQNLSIKLEGNANNVSANTKLEWPNFLKENQVLSAEVNSEHIILNSFESTSVSAGVSIGRWFDKRRTFISAGLEIEYLQENTGNDLLLASLPLKLDFDRTNSLFNPTKGFEITGELTPFLNLKDNSQTYLKSEVGISSYLPLAKKEKFILASWANVGALVGDKISNIPTSKRFFIGGSGSVRAYANDSISASGITGAAAKLEGGLELRTRFSDTIGAVTFLEGGKVFASLDEDIKSNWRAGAGLGLRYFTAFGPVRVDFAVPISEKADFNDLQIHVGLGQAF